MTPPVLARTLSDGTRAYIHPLTGETVPSVTTVLKMLHKPALDGWAAKIAAQYANDNWDDLTGIEERERVRLIKTAHQDVSQKAADLGTLLHEICDAFAKGVATDIPKQADPYINQFLGFLADVKPVFLETEATVWSRKYQYAGTFDALVALDDDVVLVDIKTGRGVYPEYGLQVSALSHADFLIRDDGKEEEFPAVTRHAVLHLRPRSWKFIDIFEAEECFASFLACRKLYRWQKEIASHVLGGM